MQETCHAFDRSSCLSELELARAQVILALTMLQSGSRVTRAITNSWARGACFAPCHAAPASGTWGHGVAIAYDGRSGLRLVTTFQPESALIDIALRGMTGYEVARQTPRTRRGQRKGMTLAADRLATQVGRFAFVNVTVHPTVNVVRLVFARQILGESVQLRVGDLGLAEVRHDG